MQQYFLESFEAALLAEKKQKSKPLPRTNVKPKM